MFTLYTRSNSLDHARLAVTVSRRVSLRANRRNRIKRTIRESFRCNQPPLRGLDVVVVARSAADRASSEALRASLLSFWSAVRKPCRPSSSS